MSLDEIKHTVNVVLEGTDALLVQGHHGRQGGALRPGVNLHLLF